MMVKAESVFQIVRAYFSPRGKTVIEVGCGSGELVRQLAVFGARAYGVDTAEVIRRARASALPEGVEFLEAGEGFAALDGIRADLVVFCASLHHFRPGKLESALGHYTAPLKPGGCLMVLEPVPAAGYYYDLLRLIDDEKVILERTYRVLRRLELPDMVFEGEYHWYVEHSLEDFARLVGANYDDPVQMRQMMGIARQLVSTLLEKNPWARIMHSRIRLNLYRKVLP